jgi:rRNA maturation endonuclease Nob1
VDQQVEQAEKVFIICDVCGKKFEVPLKEKARCPKCGVPVCVEMRLVVYYGN